MTLKLLWLSFNSYESKFDLTVLKEIEYLLGHELDRLRDASSSLYRRRVRDQERLSHILDTDIVAIFEVFGNSHFLTFVL